MAPDRRQTKSKYTSDRKIPGAFEGETVTRRRLMTGTVNGAGIIAASAFLLPALGFAVGPIFEKHKQRWQDVGGVDQFPDDTYIPKTITTWMRSARPARRPSTSASTTRRSTPTSFPRASSTSSTSRSPPAACTSAARCATSAAAERFICPCHGGVYDFQGKVAGGPPVRPLDRFYTRVRNGRVRSARASR